MQDPRTIWSELEKDNSRSTGYIRLRVEPSSCCGLFLAIEKPENHKAVLLEVPAKAIPPKVDYPQSLGFSLIPMTITPGPNGHVRLILMVTDSKYVDIFSVLVGDIINHVAAQPDERSGVIEFVARLKRWQNFLRTHAPEGLGEQAQQGLYGELWFLRHFLLPNIPAKDVVTAWVGPVRTNQDFQFDRCAIEVKTTSGVPPQVIQITNIRQLDDTGVEALILFHVALDVRLGGVQSLPELVSEIRGDLQIKDETALSTFNERLVDAGYLDVHQDRYAELKYAIRAHHFFKVKAGFPRILETDLLLGVGDVCYSIALASCMPFEINEREALGYVKGALNA